MRFEDDDPFFSEVSNLIDIIEDTDEKPKASQIYSSYEGIYALNARQQERTDGDISQMLSKPTSSPGLSAELVSGLGRLS